MPIVPSRAERVRTLVKQLASERAADRDSAVAQLTLLGPRVVEPLRASLTDAPVAARLATLEVLERLEDPGAIPVILALVEDSSGAVAGRAIELAGELADPRSASALAAVLTRGPASQRRAAAGALAQLHGGGLVEALDPLVDALLDEEADTRLRLVILDALLRLEPPLPRSTLRPLGRRLSSSGDPALASRAKELAGSRERGTRSSNEAEDVVERLTRGEVSESEARKLAVAMDRTEEALLERLREALDRAEDPRGIHSFAVVLESVGGAPAIPALKRALARLAEVPGNAGDPGERLAARAAIHSTLAALDSRVALHDLRELITLRPAGLMPGLLEAAGKIGDASLVPALAHAATEDPILLEPCAATYRTIARREKLRRTSRALRKVRTAHRPALDAFLDAARRR